jgi:hypothetical protein
MLLRIKFNASQATDLDPTVLIKLIIDELNKTDGYRIIMETRQYVAFKYNILGPGYRTDVFKNVDGGKFEIKLKERSVLSLNYYISFVFEAIASFILIILGVVQDYHLFYFIIFIVIMFLIRIISVKMAGERMIDSILSSNVN